MPGMIEYIRYQTSEGKYNLNMDSVQKKLTKTDTKRTDLKRTLLPYQKNEGNGYKLEKRVEYKLPKP